MPNEPPPPDRDAQSGEGQDGDVLARYRAAARRLDDLIDTGEERRDRSLAAVKARAEGRLGRLRRFLAHIGDPQDAPLVVHVAGTSGKGSTAVAIAAVLSAAGHRVGLYTSPYLQVATEKLQIDGRLIAAGAFADIVDEVLSAAADWDGGGGGDRPLTYGEVWMALAAVWFAREGVEVAVVEVGAGGRFDPTNVVRPAVSVVTTVGLDHTATLGPTIAEIAWHKAGIVKAGGRVVTAVADPDALAAILAEASAVGTDVTRVVEGETFEIVAADADGLRWRERKGGPPGPVFVPPQPGRFQAANAATALAAVRALASRGYAPNDGAIAAGLAAARLQGRVETMPGRSPPTVLLDGAHNPEKMSALLAWLGTILGSEGSRPVAVFGALGDKDAATMVRLLAPAVGGLVLTAPRVLGKPAADPRDLAVTAVNAGVPGPVLIEPEPATALDAAVAVAGRGGAAVLVTGSLYLLGNVRGRWYPDHEVVLQRTPWPRQATLPEGTIDAGPE